MSHADRHTLPPDVQSALNAYTSRLTELVAACARTQRTDPEAFLWNARRALEAMCLTLLTAHHRKVARRQTDARGRHGLYSLIGELQQQGLLHPEDLIRFNAAREHSNLGVHIRQPEREDYCKACDDLAHLLPVLVDWLFKDSVAADYLVRDVDMTNALVDIKAGGQWHPDATHAAAASDPVTRRGSGHRTPRSPRSRALGHAGHRWPGRGRRDRAGHGGTQRGPRLGQPLGNRPAHTR
ncbi:MAG: hypothetical protein GXP62_18925 [Oligoflexia bacterium]|nr:hypothetical protein [Oligoflexia bacterium]